LQSSYLPVAKSFHANAQTKKIKHESTTYVIAYKGSRLNGKYDFPNLRSFRWNDERLRIPLQAIAPTDATKIKVIL